MLISCFHLRITENDLSDVMITSNGQILTYSLACKPQPYFHNVYTCPV